MTTQWILNKTAAQSGVIAACSRGTFKWVKIFWIFKHRAVYIQSVTMFDVFEGDICRIEHNRLAWLIHSHTALIVQQMTCLRTHCQFVCRSFRRNTGTNAQFVSWLLYWWGSVISQHSFLLRQSNGELLLIGIYPEIISLLLVYSYI